MDEEWEPNGGRHALHAAAEAGDIRTVEALLRSGVDPNLADSWDSKPLHYATLQGQLDAARLLLDAGADVNAPTQHGVNALAHAVFGWRRSPDLVALLRRAGADPFHEDSSGRTPRQYSALDPQGDLLADLPDGRPLPPRPWLRDGDPLSPEELELTIRVVDSVVAHDDTALSELGAFQYGDPYMWTYQYGPWPAVTLRRPFGPPSTWDVSGSRFPDSVAVDVAMWTREEGPPT